MVKANVDNPRDPKEHDIYRMDPHKFVVLMAASWPRWGFGQIGFQIL